MVVGDAVERGPSFPSFFAAHPPPTHLIYTTRTLRWPRFAWSSLVKTSSLRRPPSRFFFSFLFRRGTHFPIISFTHSSLANLQRLKMSQFMSARQLINLMRAAFSIRVKLSEEYVGALCTAMACFLDHA